MGVKRTSVAATVTLSIVAAGLAPLVFAAGAADAVKPATMPRIATVDERFQSFNVEMVEVTGGRFWAPYKSSAPVATSPDAPAPVSSARDAAKASAPAGLDPALFRYRQPIDLSNPRLRKLATALGPMYVRVSGTWANSTYFQDSDGPAPATPPAGFGGVLTRQEWKGVVDFSHAVDAKIVTSFAISGGVHNAEGVWTPVEAKKFLAYTSSIGGTIAAAEMFNEPTVPVLGGAPKGYDAAAYGRDFKVFRPFVKEAAPEMLILGPGSVGEVGLMGSIPIVRTEDILTAAGPGVDAFSYHFYGAVSKRCEALGSSNQTTVEAALTNEWLSRTNRDEAFYAALRDRFEPGKPMWLTETGETACGGNPWASTFVDSFRYLNQLGTLAKHGVQVVMHNTLAASDYALIDEDTLTPRPNYWAAVLWRRMMGTTVLDAGVSGNANLHVYAHCLREHPGGVAMLVINADRTGSQSLELPVKSDRYTLTGQGPLGAGVALNGVELKLESGDALPKLAGNATANGRVEFAPASITFLAIPGAGNAACK